MDPTTEARIDERIRRIARGRRGARGELKDHVMEAVREASGGDADAHHVDAAFASLGTDHEIRETFFPKSPRLPVDPWSWAGLGLAVILVVASGLISGGDAGSCRVEGQGTCTATARGDLADAALLVLGPILAAAMLLWAPAAALVPAAALFVFAVVRLQASIGPAAPDVITLVAALLTLVVSSRHAMRAWRFRQ